MRPLSTPNYERLKRIVKKILTILMWATAIVQMVGTAHAQTADSQASAIETVLGSYVRAVKASDVSAVLNLYTKDAVVMVPGSSAAVGIDQIETTYRSIFRARSIDGVIKIAEIQVLSPTWAFARSNSSGTMRLSSTGTEISFASQELFILEKS